MATDHNFKVKKGIDVLGGDVNLGDGFAYKIDGTTVVDSSRNLSNIGTISSGAITSTGDIEVRSGNKLILQRPNNAVASTISTDSTGAMILDSLNSEGFFFNNAGVNAFKIDPINATFAGTISSGAITSSGAGTFANRINLTDDDLSSVSTAIKTLNNGGLSIEVDENNEVANTDFRIRLDRSSGDSQLVLDASGNLDIEGAITSSGKTSIAASTSTSSSSSLKLHVGTINSTGSSAIAQFGGFIRAADYYILHASAGSTDSLIIDYVGDDMDITAGEGSYTGVLRANGYKVGTTTVIGTGRLVQNVDLKAGNSGARLKNDNWFYDTAAKERIYFHSSNNYYKTASTGGSHIWRVSGDTQVMSLNSGGDLTIPGDFQAENATFTGTGDVTVKIIADTDNATETDNPTLGFSQDGNTTGTLFVLGLEGNPNTAFPGSIVNAPYLHGNVASTPLQIANTGKLVATFDSTSTNAALTVTKFSNITGTNGSTILNLKNYMGSNETTGDLSQQKSFIDFQMLDSNGNEVPQVRIGAEVGQGGDANTQEKEGSGAFVVYTNTAESTSGDAGASLTEKFRVAHDGTSTFTNNVVIGGNLTVNGTQTTLNTATLQVEDKNIVLNYGTGDTSGSANGAGITIQDAINSSTDATMLWNASSNRFDFSHKVNATGDISGYDFYGQDHYVLNSAGNGWHEWATRSDDRVNLSVHDISANGALNVTTGRLTFSDGGYSIGNELHVWKRDYVVNNTSPKDVLYHDGSALPNGGAYRVQAHIPGTGTDQSATAVFWNQNGTWKVNATYQSGTSSNHPEFIVGSNGKPQIHIDHTSNYTISILHERLELGESTGTDNKSGFGADGYLSEVLGVLRHNPYGGSDHTAGNRIFADNYHPNANKWTTARSHTVTLTGEVTGTATQSVDGTGNKTWSIATTVNNTSLDDQYVDVTGDTMTGNLTIGTTTDSTKLVFPDKNVLENPTAVGNKRQLIGMGNSGAGGMWQTTGRGGLMLASADDSLILASGDIGRGHDPDAGGWNPNPDDENIYLLTDSAIYLRTNLQTVSDYKQMSFDANGDLTVSRDIIASGNVQHTGLTMTSGTDIDQLYTVTDSLTLTTSYQDTSINGGELSTGTYILQLYIAGDHSVGGSHYNEFYSGVISWYGGATNSTDVDEIVLHRAGHAPNASVIHLRTQRHASGGDNLVLQIKGNYTMTAARNYVFKFRRMI